MAKTNETNAQKPKSKSKNIKPSDKQDLNKKQNKSKTKNKKESSGNSKSALLTPRNSSRFMKIKDQSKGVFVDDKNSIPQKKKSASKKTQELVGVIRESNYKQVKKQKYTSQNKNDFNLSYLLSDEQKQHDNVDSNHVQGILKKTDDGVLPASKNNATDIKANVIGKKSDVKVIANKGLFAVTIGCIVLVIASIIVNFVVYSYFKHVANFPPITITKTVEVELKPNENSIVSVKVPRNILPNSRLHQAIDVFTQTLSQPVVVRVKSILTTADGDILNVPLEFESNWIKGEDEYYYLNQTLSTGSKLEAVNYLTVPKELTLEMGKLPYGDHVITFIFECINYSQNLITNFWLNTPQSWLS